MSEWIGCSLEELTLIQSPHSTRKTDKWTDPIITSSELGSLLLGSRNTLKMIKIENAGTKDDKMSDFKGSDSFPSLGTLSIKMAAAPISKFFEHVSSPQLLKLELTDEYNSTAEESDITLDCLTTLLSKYSGNLIEFSFKFENKVSWSSSPEPKHKHPPPNLKLSFPKLEILNVKVNQYYEPGDLIKWFGKFKYPVVKSMDTNSKDVRE